MAREPYVSMIRRFTPPWLQRSRGGRYLESLAAQADELVTRTLEGVALRLPGALGAIEPAALALTGRERRIRRGPGESAETYARRIRLWWDAHRGRGGYHALLGQLRAFFADWLEVRMDLVYHSGTRRWMDVDGTITRDAIEWDADGSEQWAQVWLFYHLPATITLDDIVLLTEDDEEILTEEDEVILVPASISVADLSDEQAELFLAIPREWNAAHIWRFWIVLFYGLGRLWDYPEPVPTYDEWEASGALWDEPSAPKVYVIESPE